MILLLTKDESGSLAVYSPETYGMETWGMSTQRSIDKKDDGWYTTYWSSGGEWLNDTYEEDKLDVIIETGNLDEVLSYVIENKPEYLSSIITELKEIVTEYLDYEYWFRTQETSY